MKSLWSTEEEYPNIKFSRTFDVWLAAMQLTKPSDKVHKFKLDYVSTATFLPRVATLLTIFRTPERMEQQAKLQQVIYGHMCVCILRT